MADNGNGELGMVCDVTGTQTARLRVVISIGGRPVRTVRPAGLRTRPNLHRSREVWHSIYPLLVRPNRKKRQDELPSGRNVCLKCLQN